MFGIVRVNYRLYPQRYCKTLYTCSNITEFTPDLQMLLQNFYDNFNI